MKKWLLLLFTVLSVQAWAATTCNTAVGGPACSGPKGALCINTSWTVSVSQVDGYNVYRGLTSGGPYTKLTSALVNGTAWQDNAVSPATNYFYVATASKGGIESTYSNETCSQTPTVPAPPTGVSSQPNVN